MFFFFNDTATTEIYTLSLHDALPILQALGIARRKHLIFFAPDDENGLAGFEHIAGDGHAVVGKLLANMLEERSEEHTSELQSHLNLVCRLLLEKKKKTTKNDQQSRST